MVKPSQQLITKVVVAGVCASDRRYERAVAVPVVKKKKTFQVTLAALESAISTRS